MNDYDLLIFDLDGTLLNTVDDVHQSINIALEKLALPIVTEEQTRKAIGPGPDVFSHYILGKEHLHRFEEFLGVYRPIYFTKSTEKTRPFQGVIDLLDQLDGIKTAIATNKPLRSTMHILNGLDLIRYFNIIASPDLVEREKPAPDMLEYILTRSNYTANRALFIGDTNNDILAAQAAGIKSVYAEWGYAADGNELKEMADFTLCQPLDVLELLGNPSNEPM